MSEKIFGTGYRTIAVCLYAGMESVNYYAVQGRGYTLGTFLYLTALYCLYRICCLNEQSRKYFIVFSLMLTMGLYTVVTSLYWVVPLCVAGGIFLLFRDKRQLWRLIRYSLLAALNTVVIYSLVWIAVGCNLLQDTSNSPYYGWDHLAILKADIPRCWLCGERYMRGSEWVQSIALQDVWSNFGVYWRGVLNGMYSNSAWLLLALCLVIPGFAVAHAIRRGKVSENESFALSCLTTAIILIPLILLIQSALPFERVFSFTGVLLTFVIVYCLDKIRKLIPDRRKNVFFVVTVLTMAFLFSRLMHPYYNRQYGEREGQCLEMLECSGMAADNRIVLLDEFQTLVSFFYNKECIMVEDIKEADCLIMPLETMDKKNKFVPWPVKYCYADLDWDYINKEFEYVAENNYYQLFCRKNLK